jgi:FKBP-type peptidyl-prolyl cis-trans isomerase FklB
MQRCAAAVFGFILLACNSYAAEDPVPGDKKNMISYSLGYQAGSDFRRQDIDIDQQVVLQGVMDAVEGREPAMSAETMRETLMELQQSVNRKP